MQALCSFLQWDARAIKTFKCESSEMQLHSTRRVLQRLIGEVFYDWAGMFSNFGRHIYPRNVQMLSDRVFIFQIFLKIHIIILCN